MNTTEILDKLCGAGENADSAKKFAMKYLSDDAKVETDVSGNIIAHFAGRGKKLLCDAHMDKIGFVVTAINEQGFLKVAPSGGVDLRVLLSQEVVVYGKERFSGVISCLPPHLTSKDAHKAVERDEIYVDAGMNKEQAEKSVPLGSFVAFKSGLRTLLGGNMTAAALDDRAGVAAMLVLSDMLEKEEELPFDTYIVLSEAEEVGCRGAMPAAFAIEPDQAIVVDVSFGSDRLTKPEKSGCLAKGPMVGIAPVLDKAMTDSILRIADAENIEYQYEVMGGEAGTNADVISNSRAGVKTAMLSIPLRNMHTQTEVINTADIENTAKLIYRYIMSGGEGNV